MAKESEVEKEVKQVEKSAKKFFKNYWAVATIILAVLLIIVLVVNSASSISKAAAGQKILAFAESRGLNATIVNVTSDGSLYQVIVLIQGQEVPVYLTKDGKNLVPSIVPLEIVSASTSTATQPQADVPKTDKPVANFFVFAYCPYGTQMEKALIPVYNLLKGKADINIVFIGAMHGEFEHVESLRQICIQKNYGNDKYFTYLDKFLANTAIGNCQGTDTCVNPLIEPIYGQLGINKNTINTCMATDAEALYNQDGQLASQLGIGSSPTVTVNGVEVQMGRSPAEIQKSICSAFNNAPAECNQALSSTAASPGFGSASGTNSGASC